MQLRLEHEGRERFVPYIGDDPEGPIYPGWTPYIPMATALAYLFSDEGFVIAADGRNTLVSAKGREVVSDQAQKIFPVHGIDRQAAFSFTGRTTLYDQADESVAFDFPSEFIRAAAEIETEAIGSAEVFLSKVCSVVQKRLDLVVRTIGVGKLPSPRNRFNPSEHTVVSIFLDGYFSSWPARAGANFFHVNQELTLETNPVHSLKCPKTYWTSLLGSRKIGSLLFEGDDARFAQYRTEACKRVTASYKDPTISVTLQDAIEVARNYIAACSDPAIREIDIENCQGIGGHIHIATITPKDGFRWVRAPMSSTR